MKRNNGISTSIYALTGVLFLTSEVYAGGYQIKAFNTPSLGLANAGSSVQFGSVEYLARNPALIAYMNTHQAAASASLIIPSIKFSNQGSTLAGSPVLIQGSNGGNSAKNAVIPAAYLGYSYNNQLKFAFGVTSEWGLETSYSPQWVGRYHNLKSSMRSVIMEPAVGFKINEQWAVGAGVNVQYMRVRLSRAIDTTSILNAGIVQNVPAALQVPALGAATLVGLGRDGSSANDSQVALKGDDWGLGGSVGLTYQPQKATKFGASYRSQVHHTLKGDKLITISDATNIRLNTFGQIGNGVFAPLINGIKRNLSSSKIKANLTTPDTALFGASHDITQQWTVLGEVTWTHWSKMKEIRVRTTNISGIADDVTTLKWKNTVAYAAGLIFKPEHLKNWTFRTGFAYDPTPIRTSNRIPSVPDNDRYWGAVGVGYEPHAQWNLSLSYAYEWLPKAKVNLKPELGSLESLRGNFVGKYKSNIHILSAQAIYRF